MAGAVLLGLIGCGGGGNGGAGEARLACEKGRPAIDATSSTWGETLDAYVAAQAHSGKAAADDKRWAPLNDAFRTLVGAWTDAVAAGGREARDNAIDPAKQAAALQAGAKWLSAASTAEGIVRSECAAAEHA